LVTSNIQYLLDQSNEVKDDIRRLRGALWLTGAKWTYNIQGYKRGY